MSIVCKKIDQLVAENYVYASVLHHFGIQFYNYAEKTLGQVCQEKGLDVQQLVKSLESIQEEGKAEISLINYPVDLVIQYLQHMHYIFVKEKLPYMATLIQDLGSSETSSSPLVRDLQILFPLFVEDFIKHIYEEEDTLFKYILQLQKASCGYYNYGELYYAMEKNSMQYFALDHHSHNDEMRGIREITNDYTPDHQGDLHVKVIFEELKSLEKMLKIHAKIEDEILFMKALRLERLVKEMLRQKVKSN